MNSAMNTIRVPAGESVVERSVPREHNFAISYLRAFVTVLVLAHHAVLAYCTFVPPPPTALTAQPRLWAAFPVVDSMRWAGFNLLVGFNDTFFMSLMFFLSGLFVWNSLKRKGSGWFLRDRVLRLGVPFLAAAALVAPIAYYPAYLQTGASGVSGFVHQWLSLGNWPAGPAWFIWVLLVFDSVVAGLYLLASKFGDGLGKSLASVGRRPVVFFAGLVALSAAAYLSMELKFNAFYWFSFGPFFVQTSRLLHYFLYFIVGIGVGVYGTSQGLLAADGRLARRWWFWLIAAIVGFLVNMGVGLTAITTPSRMWEAAADISYAISCAASGFFFLAVFTNFMQHRGKIWDSLSANAYGMYLLHYAFVSWLQYALLRTHLAGIVKGSLVLLGTLVLSWGVTAALRRIPAVGRVI